MVGKCHDRFKDLGMYYAAGLNGQRVRIIPEADLVIVNLVNTYKRHNFFEDEQLELLDKILGARISKPKNNPEIEELNLSNRIKFSTDSISFDFLGEYEAPWDFDPAVESISISIEYRNEGLIANIQYGGTYKMIKVSNKKYIMEDMDLLDEMEFPIEFFIEEWGIPAFKLKLAFVLEEVIFKKVL